MPSLENWGGGLKSLLWLANSPHVQYHTITLSSDTLSHYLGPCYLQANTFMYTLHPHVHYKSLQMQHNMIETIILSDKSASGESQTKHVDHVQL